MMMKADLALYRAKNDGRNQFRFHVTELDEQTQERMVIGEELRHAIKRGELELYYQPQVELASGSIVGLEALVRWNHPKRGMMLPTAFIPIAETTGSVVPIGEWVIKDACQQIKIWSDLGIAPPIVAINISGAQFKLASQLDQVVPKISPATISHPRSWSLSSPNLFWSKPRNVMAKRLNGCNKSGCGSQLTISARVIPH